MGLSSTCACAPEQAAAADRLEEGTTHSAAHLTVFQQYVVALYNSLESVETNRQACHLHHE